MKRTIFPSIHHLPSLCLIPLASQVITTLPPVITLSALLIGYLCAQHARLDKTVRHFSYVYASYCLLTIETFAVQQTVLCITVALSAYMWPSPPKNSARYHWKASFGFR